MEIEDKSRHNPQVAEKFREWQSHQEEVLPKKPIEEVAQTYLQELDRIKNRSRNQVPPDFNAHPLILAFGNGRFIEQQLKTHTLKELIIRTNSDIVFDKRRHLIFGVDEPLEALASKSKKHQGEPEVCLLFNDGRNYLNVLNSIDSFQESWDRSDKEGRKELLNFARLSKDQIIKKFEALAKQNLRLTY